jgi:hypothetical protein
LPAFTYNETSAIDIPIAVTLKIVVAGLVGKLAVLSEVIGILHLSLVLNNHKLTTDTAV